MTRTLPAILRDAGRVYARFPFVLMSIPFIELPLRMLPWIAPIANSRLNRFLVWAAQQAVTPLVVGAMIMAANEAITGVRPDQRRSFEAAGRRYPALVSTFLLEVCLTLASLIAFPYFLIRWTFTDAAVMLDGRRNWEALDRSAALVRGRWWRVLGVLLVVLSWGLVTTIGLQVLDLTGHGALGIRLSFSVIGLAVRPYVVIAELLLYYDLRARIHEPAPLPVLLTGAT